MESKIAHYCQNVLIAFDRFCNALLAGEPEETISCRMGKAVRDGRCKLCRPLCWLLHQIDPDHCLSSIVSETKGSETNRWLHSVGITETQAGQFASNSSSVQPCQKIKTSRSNHEQKH